VISVWGIYSAGVSLSLYLAHPRPPALLAVRLSFSYDISGGFKGRELEAMKKKIKWIKI